LHRIHSDETITRGNKSSYDFWNSKPTEEIIESLKPNSDIPLKVYPNGGIADGNTRTKILEERGVDVNKLERIIQVIEDVPKIPE
jgi:hypothetical protein